jgi:hypothetical protein
MAGQWFLGGCTKPEAIGADAQALAVAFAKRLINDIQ